MAFLANGNLFLKQLLVLSIRLKRCGTPNCVDVKMLGYTHGISDTTLQMQNGRNIKELPLVVQKVSTNKATQVLFHEHSIDEDKSSAESLEKEVLEDMIKSLRKCNSFLDVFKLVEIVPVNSLQPEIAYEILKRLIKIGQVYSASGEIVSDEEASTKCIKPVIKFLMGVVLSNKQPEILISCLRTMNQNDDFRKYVQSFEKELQENIMLNVVQNKFNIIQITEIVKEFHFAGYLDQIDKVCIGIIDNVHSIDRQNILKLYHILPYFKGSRYVVSRTLLEKMSSLWCYMEGRDITELLDLTKRTSTYSYKLLLVLGRWLNTRIHSLKEDELLIIINGFSNVNFVSTEIISALERYIKIRGHKIRNSFLFAGIMDYCLKFRLRSTIIFEKACDYFIAKKETLPPAVIKSLFVPFGFLNYVPTRSYEFWKTFEEILEDKFIYFNPEHVLNILLSCVYLEKYPINFVNNVFDAYFLNKLQVSCENWPVTRKQLILFDHIMTSECKAYKGPMLSRDLTANIFCTDERIKFLIGKIRESLVEMIGSADRILLNKCLRTCPAHNVCSVDVFLVPGDAKMPYLSNFSCTKNPYVAILIHVPEHYTSDEEILIGPQAMRKRHLEKLGIVVVDLSYLYLLKLLLHRNRLIRYVTESIEEAELSFHSGKPINK